MKHEIASDALAGTHWRKSSFSEGENNCVEVAPGNLTGAVRDSKNAASPALLFDRAAFAAFIVSTKTN